MRLRRHRHRPPVPAASPRGCLQPAACLHRVARHDAVRCHGRQAPPPCVPAGDRMRSGWISERAGPLRRRWPGGQMPCPVPTCGMERLPVLVMTGRTCRRTRGDPMAGPGCLRPALNPSCFCRRRQAGEPRRLVAKGRICVPDVVPCPDAGGFPVTSGRVGGRESHPPTSSMPASSHGNSRWQQGRDSGWRDMAGLGRVDAVSISIVSERRTDRSMNCSSCMEFQHHARKSAHRGRVFAKE